tara:strand:+ start:5855 stop:7474 length:1620 start_codon:yes stop_codon:yes gene_type:complete
MAFVEGFARRTSEIIRESETEATDYKEEMREMAERNRSKIQAMQESVKQNEAFVIRARNLGASDAQISMALDTSPTALRDMVTTLTELKNNPASAGSYGPEMIARTFVVPEDYTNIDTNVKARFGGNFAVGDTTAPEGGGFFQDLYGVNAMGTARAELDQEMLSGTNMSIFDAAGLGDFDFYNTLSPGTVSSFVEPQFMDAERTNVEMMRYLQKYKQIVESTEAQVQAAFNDWLARTTGERARANIEPNRPEESEQREMMAELRKQAEAAQDKMIAQHFATAAEGVYGYDRAMGPQVAASGNDRLTQYAASLLDPTFEMTSQIGVFNTDGSDDTGESNNTGGSNNTVSPSVDSGLPYQNADEAYDLAGIVEVYQNGQVAFHVDPITGRAYRPGSRQYISNVDIRQITSAVPGLLSLSADGTVPYTGQNLNDIEDIQLNQSIESLSGEVTSAIDEASTPEVVGAASPTSSANQEEVDYIKNYVAEILEELRRMDEDPTFIGTIGANAEGSRDEAKRRLEEALTLAQERLASLVTGSNSSR